MARLVGGAIQQQMRRLQGTWQLSSDEAAILRKFTFKDFNEAFGFMTRVAMKADAMNHHPEWTNVYNAVDVRLTTHDVQGLTANDFQLALFMDSLASTN